MANIGRIITTKFPGVCADCGEELPVGEPVRWYGRGRIYGLVCHAAPIVALQSVAVGRCEDAPFCGCCDPVGAVALGIRDYGFMDSDWA